MRIALLGNGVPEHSTENELRRAWLNNGHDVHFVQEGEPERLDALIFALGTRERTIDLISWTRTASLAEKSGDARYWKLIAEARRVGIPIVSYHLDRWMGLARQAEIDTSPFFRTDLVATADGGHQPEWEAAGVNHVWFPPGISERHCRLGTPQERFKSDIAFVGSWQGGYHPEDVYRPALINWLKRNYDRRVKFWPEPGQHAIRGDDLTDLYASVKVVVGTSCLAPKVDGTPMTHYCSDRIPETLGRGGLLVHPSVEGIDHLYDYFFPSLLGDWAVLKGTIEDLLDAPEQQATNVRRMSVVHIKDHHTYEVRVRELIALLNERGML